MDIIKNDSDTHKQFPMTHIWQGVLLISAD